MGKKQDDFMKGMEAGARPFEEKFEKLSKETSEIGKTVNAKLDGIGDVIDILADDLSDMQKKELYHLNTPYDLKEDLDDDEKEIVAALLLALSEHTENNEYQKKFIRAVNAYIGVKSPQTGFDVECIENIENIKSQKIIMQTIMEYLYLANEDFSFLDEMEEVFDHFSVNKKGIREIESYIETIYRATGKDGIAEKYGFVPKEEAIAQVQAEQEKKNEFHYYDGSDISEACADKINIHAPYIVLNDYIVYSNSRTKKLYRVHKQTGEAVEISIDIEDKDTIDWYDIMQNICGYDKYIYLVHINGIYMMDIEANKNMTKIRNIETSGNMLYKSFFGDLRARSVFPECNDKYLIYCICRPKEGAIEAEENAEEAKEVALEIIYYCMDLRTMEEKEIDLKNIAGSRKLINNVVYFIGDRDSAYAEGSLYKYNLETGEKEKITELDYDTANSFLKLEWNKNHPLTYQYGKYLISVKDSYYQEGVSYYCLDMENDRFDLIQIPDTKIYGVDFIYCSAMYNYIYYYSESSNIERYDIITRKKEIVIRSENLVEIRKVGIIKKVPILRDDGGFTILGNWIYYSDHHKFMSYKLNIKGKSEQRFRIE